MTSQDDLPGAGPAPAPLPPPIAPAVSATVPVPGRLDSVIEQFARDYIKDRRSDRRWRLIFRGLWLLLIVLMFWSLLAARKAANLPSGPHTALVEIRGEIASDTEASAERIVNGLKTAFEEPNAQAVVLRINSPGGSPVQAGIVNDEIHRLKLLHKKKVYAVVEEMCASGAYYIAVAADEIYTDKASVVGSIGVLMDGFGFTGIMQKLGIERRLYTAGENKGMNDPFTPESDKQRAYTQAMLDQIHKQFIRKVKEGRGKRLKETSDTFSGLYWNGEDAVKFGLADKFGNLDYIAREVVHAEEIIDYTPKENIAERLAKRLGASMGAGAVRALQGAGTIH
ncbi:MAG: S49 family peptidase [Burkholderiales bacterium]|jgi:protease-4|nr:S49 family peptidase [Burkholderiales bacterium]